MSMFVPPHSHIGTYLIISSKCVGRYMDRSGYLDSKHTCARGQKDKGPPPFPFVPFLHYYPTTFLAFCLFENAKQGHLTLELELG